MSNQVNDEHMEVLGAFIHAVISTSKEFALYVNKWELHGFLTRNEVELMNEVAISCQKFLDTEKLNQAKGAKSDGKLGQ